MAAPFLIRAVNELLSDIGGKGKKLLDVSCKEGDILESVKSKGFICRGTNFEPNSRHRQDTAVDYDVDLRNGLPYEDESFDIVLLVEVLEHISCHDDIIRELSRILKPGGILILTTPNVMRLNSRVHFLLTGYHKTKRRFIPFETQLAEAHKYHNFPIDFPVLYYFAKQNGLNLEALGHSKVKAYSRFLLALLWLPVSIYSWYTLYVREHSGAQTKENLKLLRWLCHPRILTEDNLALRFRKTMES